MELAAGEKSAESEAARVEASREGNASLGSALRVSANAGLQQYKYHAPCSVRYRPVEKSRIIANFLFIIYNLLTACLQTY